MAPTVFALRLSLKNNIPGLNLIPNTFRSLQIPKIHFQMYKNHSVQMLPS